MGGVRLLNFRGTKGLVAIVVFTMGSGLVHAEADGPDFFRAKGVTAGDTLHIRSAPNAHARKLGEIPPDGTCLRNLGCQGGLSFKEFTELTPAQQAQRLRSNPRWCKVEYRGITGWVAGRYLAEGLCP